MRERQFQRSYLRRELGSVGAMRLWWSLKNPAAVVRRLRSRPKTVADLIDHVARTKPAKPAGITQKVKSIATRAMGKLGSMFRRRSAA